ncbi:MAG: phosphopyruvate hydratase [Clostridia bacterium]|nr:phosphopyruvate hydratase [Clostridia bacterium]
MRTTIKKVNAREIIDSRGNPTVEATVLLEDGTKGVASVPSGASTGIFEAHEKRDEDSERYFGKGVHGATRGIREEISPVIEGKSARDQCAVDHAMWSLDGTENKSNLGANAILAVSLATAHAASNYYRLDLFRYLGGANARRLPVPMFNILNGGAHASNNVEIQEFMIVPVGVSAVCEAVRAGCEIYKTLGSILKKNGYSTAVGDEGGYAPDLKNDEEAISLICQAIKEAGYTENEIKIALDVASSEWYESGSYRMPKSNKEYTAEQLIDYYEKLIDKYPIISIEDGLSETDYNGWKKLTVRLGNKVMLVGDDLFVTNENRLIKGILEGLGNAILIKPNQIGTLTETLNVIRTANESGYKCIISHRSGETEDTTIADLAVAVNAPFIKTGAPCRGERTAKYNRLTKIEMMLGCGSIYGKINLKQ